jgi:hypothetical protein
MLKVVLARQYTESSIVTTLKRGGKDKMGSDYSNSNFKCSVQSGTGEAI